MKSGFIFTTIRGGSGSGRGGGSGGAVRPLGRYQVKPRYPELARRLGIEGTVLPNATLQARGAAAATQERRLFSVACKRGVRLWGTLRLRMGCPYLANPQAPAFTYWSTSSASIRRCGGIVTPRAFAVFRLITSSNFMGCSTGRSAGLAPLKILST